MREGGPGNWPGTGCSVSASEWLRQGASEGHGPPVCPGAPGLGSEGRVGYLVTSAKCHILALWHSRASGIWHSGTRPCLALGTLALEKRVALGTLALERRQTGACPHFFTTSAF